MYLLSAADFCTTVVALSSYDRNHMTLQKPKYFLSCSVQKSLPTPILRSQTQGWCFISYWLITQNSSIVADKHWVGPKVRSDFSMWCCGKARWTFWASPTAAPWASLSAPSCSGLLPRPPPQLPQTSGNQKGDAWHSRGLHTSCKVLSVTGLHLGGHPSPGGSLSEADGESVKNLCPVDVLSGTGFCESWGTGTIAETLLLTRLVLSTSLS